MEKRIAFEDLLPFHFAEPKKSEKKGMKGGKVVEVDLSKDEIVPEYHAILFEVFARG